MRIQSLALLLLSSLACQAQVFDPKEEWFTMTSFFQRKEIADHQIQQIHIKIQSKKDGEAILKYSDFLQYNFNETGQMVRSEKSIPLGLIVDTACFIYHYNNEGQVIYRKEIQRNFNYSFIRLYQQDMPYRDIKLDENTIPFDTLYNRRLISKKSEYELVVKTLNDKSLPFMVQTETYRDGQIYSNRIDYVRNQNYQEEAFGYENGKLIRKSLHSQFGDSKDSYWIFSYESNQLTSAEYYKERERSLKRVYTYSEDGLIIDVIERDFIEKSIKIYYFSYKFSPTHQDRLGKWN